MELKQLPDNSKLKKLSHILYNILTIISVLILLDLLVETAGNNGTTKLFGYTPAVVQSGSMLPTIDIKGTVLIHKESIEKCKENDIIVYRYYDKLIVHRVVYKGEIDGKIVVHTKGDNNDLEDKIDITEDNYYGRVVSILNLTSKIFKK